MKPLLPWATLPFGPLLLLLLVACSPQEAPPPKLTPPPQATPALRRPPPPPGSGAKGISGTPIPLPSPQDDAGMVKIEDTALGPFEIDRFEFPNVEGAIPTSFVALSQAKATCEAVGKRLCTAAEWRRACLGPGEGQRFSYGSDYAPGVCHAAGELPSGYTSGLSARPLLKPSGAHPGCKSAEGVLDMIGNAEEWVLDDWNGSPGMLEGGAWYSLELFADCTGRYSRHPDFRLGADQPVFSAGMRCCRSDTPPDAEAIAKDAADRLQKAKDRASNKPYDPKNEVQLGPETYIDTFEYPNRAGETPRGAVSWGDAKGLCEGAGKRLCTTEEWQLACGGDNALPYPYGREWDGDACPNIESGPRPSGASPKCISPSGAQDMAGSLWEWTASALPVSERGQDQDLREVRGGSHSTGELKTRCIPRDGYPAAPASALYPDVGLRCCRGPELSPASSKLPQAGTSAPPYPCPQGMIFTEGTCIDTYEFPNKAGATPTGGLTYPDAQAACEKGGVHLCTSEEWEGACKGPEGRRWPYGDRYEPGRCNFGEAGRSEGGGDALASGEKAQCRTAAGVFDLSGNVWEWVEGPGGVAQLRGGGWNMNSGLGQCTFFAPSKPTWSAPDTGARCCASKEEAQALLKE